MAKVIIETLVQYKLRYFIETDNPQDLVLYSRPFDEEFDQQHLGETVTSVKIVESWVEDPSAWVNGCTYVVTKEGTERKVNHEIFKKL